MHTKRCQISASFSNCPAGENFWDIILRFTYVLIIYIIWVCFFLAIAPQGKFFWGIISGLLTGYTYKVLWHLWLFFHGRDGGKFPIPPRRNLGYFWGGILPSLEKKNTAKARFARQTFFPQTRFTRQKFVCKQLAPLAKTLSKGSLR